MSKLVGAVVVVCACVASSPASAQIPSGVAGLLPNLILNGIRLDAGSPVPHDAHFTPLNELYVGTDPRSGEAFRVDAAEVVLNFNRLLATQFATFPIGTSSGAFSFQIDESTGLPVRRTRSFGPSFGERTLTVGKGRFSPGRPTSTPPTTSSRARTSTTAHSSSCCRTTTAARLRSVCRPPEMATCSIPVSSPTS